MKPITFAYVGSSALLIMAGGVMVWMALRAYRETLRRAMIHLSIGFALVVAATASTVISTYLNGFDPARSLLLVNNGITSLGYLFVVYSLVTYE
jgi:glycerol uptake facilitator-like aquaporin